MKRSGDTEKYTQDWVKLYNEGRSVRSIAEEYGLSKTVILRAIRPFVTLRPKSPFIKFGEEWYALYLQGYTKAEIAREYNASDTVVGSILQKMGIEKESKNLKFQHLEESFISLYKSGMSLREIGEQFGVEGQTVLNYLNRNGIDARDLSEATRLIPFNEDYFSSLYPENLFVLGMIYRFGSIIYDGEKVRCLKIMSSKEEHIEYILKKLDRKKDILIHENIYYYDSIYSQKLCGEILSFGFRTSMDYDFPLLEEERLDCFLDGYIYGFMNFSEDKSRNSFSFTFPSMQIRDKVLDYLERRVYSIKSLVRNVEERSFIIENKNFTRKAKEYYMNLPAKYEKRTLKGL